jgi:hypothetical protein
MKKSSTTKNIRNFFNSVDNIAGINFEYFTSKNKLEIEFIPKNTAQKNQFKKELLQLLKDNFLEEMVPFESKKNKKNIFYFEIVEDSVYSGTIPTKIQEKGTVWIFNQVLRNTDPSTKFLSIDDIKNHKKYNELKTIFNGEVPKDWLASYLKQQEKMIELYQSPEWDVFEYNGSNTFMQYIIEISSDLGYSYSTWNPSDIWLVKDKEKVKKEISKNIMKDGKTKGQTIYELNDILRKLLQEKRLIGISLKKVSGKKAQFQYVNIDSRVFDDKILKRVKKTYNVPRSNIKIKLELSLNNNQTSFKTQDLTVKLGNNFRFQIKDNSGTFRNFGNLKFESSSSSAAARSGKSPVEKVEELLKTNGVTFKNDNKEYPKTLEEFESKIQIYKNKIEKLKRFAELGVNSSDEAIENFRIMFETGNKYMANSKLIQLDFISKVLEMNPSSKYEEFWTDMVWISLKKGKDFAPFGKLY